MRALGVIAILAAFAVAATPQTAAPAKPKPVRLTGTIQITFAGRGEETMHEFKQWIYQLDNRCGYDKTVDNRATFSWTSTWNAVSLPGLAKGLGGRSLSATAATPSGRVTGTEIRTDCGYPLPLDGWAGNSSCDEPFEYPDRGTLDARPALAGSVIVDLQAPTLALKTPTQCALRPRSSQLTASFKLSLKALTGLKRGKPLTLRVGTEAPSLIPYTRDYNCSNSEPPYEGVQIDDRCNDVLVWDGTVTLVKR
jgi:hypothetical protein